MKNFTFNRALLFISALVFVFNTALGQESRKGVIPFDTVTNMYAYKRIVEIPDKSANDLYAIGKKWYIEKYKDDKFLVDEKPDRITDLGSFQASAVLTIPGQDMRMNWVVIYHQSTSYKDKKCKIEVTDIKLSGNSAGTTNEMTLEAYEKSVETTKAGRKKNTQQYMLDLFKDINANVEKTISDLENTLKGTKKSGDW